MRKFSDTDQPVAHADATPYDKNSSSRNNISTYPACFQAFSNHHNNLSSIEKSFSKYRKKHFPCPKMPNYNPKISISSSKIPLSIIENFKKIIHLRNNRTQNNVIREEKANVPTAERSNNNQITPLCP